MCRKLCHGCSAVCAGVASSITSLSSDLVRHNETQLLVGQQDGTITLLSVSHEHSRWVLPAHGTTVLPCCGGVACTESCRACCGRLQQCRGHFGKLTMRGSKWAQLQHCHAPADGCTSPPGPLLYAAHAPWLPLARRMQCADCVICVGCAGCQMAAASGPFMLSWCPLPPTERSSAMTQTSAATSSPSGMSCLASK